jgi:hypothetical protein
LNAYTLNPATSLVSVALVVTAPAIAAPTGHGRYVQDPASVPPPAAKYCPVGGSGHWVVGHAVDPQGAAAWYQYPGAAFVQGRVGQVVCPLGAPAL